MYKSEKYKVFGSSDFYISTEDTFSSFSTATWTAYIHCFQVHNIVFIINMLDFKHLSVNVHQLSILLTCM